MASKPIVHPEYIKDPDAGPLDYGHDVSPSLQDEETVVAEDCTWTIDANPDPVASTTLIVSTSKAKYVEGDGLLAVFIEKGTLGKRYLLKVSFRTSLGRVDVRHLWILIQKT